MTSWYTPPAADPPDIDFRGTLYGGHALVLEYGAGHALLVEYGDCEFSFTCQCLTTLALGVRPDSSWSRVLGLWIRHHDAGGRVVVAHCQCGTPFSTSSFARDLADRWTDATALIWEHHTMTLEVLP